MPWRAPSLARVCQQPHSRIYLTLCHQLVEDDSNVRLSRPRVSAQSERQSRGQLHGGGSGRIRVAAAADVDDAAEAAGFSRALTPLFFVLVSKRLCDMRRAGAALQPAPAASDGRFRLLLLPPGGLQSIESAFSLLLALQVMRSELQARENVTTFAIMSLF